MKNKIVRLLKDVTFDHDEAEISLTTSGAASKVDSPYLLKSLHTKKGENVNMKKGSKLLKVLKGLVDDVETLEELEAVIEETVEESISELKDKVEELEVALEEKEAEAKSLKNKGLLDGFGIDDETVAGLTILDEETLKLIVSALNQAIAAANVEKEDDEDLEKEQDDEDENVLAKMLSREAGHSQKQRVEKADSLLSRVKKLKNH